MEFGKPIITYYTKYNHNEGYSYKCNFIIYKLNEITNTTHSWNLKKGDITEYKEYDDLFLIYYSSNKYDRDICYNDLLSHFNEEDANDICNHLQKYVESLNNIVIYMNIVNIEENEI